MLTHRAYSHKRRTEVPALSMWLDALQEQRPPPRTSRASSKKAKAAEALTRQSGAGNDAAQPAVVRPPSGWGMLAAELSVAVVGAALEVPLFFEAVVAGRRVLDFIEGLPLTPRQDAVYMRAVGRIVAGSLSPRFTEQLAVLPGYHAAAVAQFREQVRLGCSRPRAVLGCG
jgi:hypothetical protein